MDYQKRLKVAYLHATDNYLISFMQHSIDQHNINGCPMAFNNLDLQYGTLEKK